MLCTLLTNAEQMVWNITEITIIRNKNKTIKATALQYVIWEKYNKIAVATACTQKPKKRNSNYNNIESIASAHKNAIDALKRIALKSLEHISRTYPADFIL